MIDNQFEKQIREKMNRMEVEPSDGLLDSIFEKRAAARQPAAAFGLTKVIAVAAVITGLALLIHFGMGSGDQTSPLAANQNNPVTNSGQESEGPQARSESKDVLNTQSLNSSGSGSSQSHIADIVQSNRNTASKGKHQTSMAGNHPGRVSGPGQKERNSGKNSVTQTFNANPDLNAYFNVDATNRPVIASESHLGNSHMYVYQNVDPTLTDYIASNAYPHHMKPFMVAIENEEVANVNLLASSSMSRSHKPLFIDIYGSLGMGVFTTGKGAGYFKDLGKTNVSNGFGVRISKPVSNRFNVFTGLEFNQFINKYKGDFNVSKDVTEISTKTTYINDPVKGTIPVIVNDTNNYTLTKNHKVNHNNRYNVLTLPLGISYNFGFRKLDFSVNLAANLQYLKTGTYQSWSDNSESMVAKSSSSYFNVGAGISLMGSYPLTNKFRLIVEPGFRTLSIPGMKSGNSFGENIYNVSLRAGIRYTVF